MKDKKEHIVDGDYIDEDRVHYHRGGGAFIPFLLILLGLIFLARNLDIFPIDFWANIWKFWPLLLIIWGVHIVFGRGRLANLIIIIAEIIVIIFILITFFPNLAITQSLVSFLNSMHINIRI